jgi:hypothetical protein
MVHFSRKYTNGFQHKSGFFMAANDPANGTTDGKVINVAT